MAATQVYTEQFNSLPEHGVRPTDSPEIYQFNVTETDVGGDLAEAGDKVTFFKLAKGACLLDMGIQWGSHDDGGTPAFKGDVVADFAVDGNAAADANIIDATTTGQAGGYDRMGAGTSPDTSYLGKRIEADKGELSLQCDTAPANATATRTAKGWLLVGRVPP